MLLGQALELAQTSLQEQFGNEAAREAYAVLLCLERFNSKSEIIANLTRMTLETHEIDHLYSWIQRRLRGEPLAYIRGYEFFYGHEFKVNQHVLIPRPETELIPERILQLNRSGQIAREARCLDIGTGSGVLAITLKLELPQTIWVACDLSFESIMIARQNSFNLNASIHFVQSFCTKSFQKPFDIIVTNPPYLAFGDSQIQPEVHKYEPHMALYASNGGLGIIYEILNSLEEILNPRGIMLMEIGHGQHSLLEPILKSIKSIQYSFISDWSGIPRILEILRND